MKTAGLRVGYAPVVFVLAISLTFNLVLINYARQYYCQAANLKLDPASMSEIPLMQQELDNVPPERRLIALVGDSRIREWKNYPSVTGVRYVNMGVSGQTSGEVLLRMRLHAWHRKPTLAIIQVGINDLKYLGVFPHAATEITNRCVDNIRQMVCVFQSQGIRPVLLTVLPYGRPPLRRSLVWSAKTRDALDQVNHCLRTLKNSEVCVVDCDLPLRKGNYLDPMLSRDMMHLNTDGYHVLNTHVQSILMEYVGETGQREH